MEGAIINLHTSSLSTTHTLCLLLIRDQQFIVQTESALRHTRQIRLHHNLTNHLATQHRTRLGDQQIHTLQCVDEDLVLTVRDTLTTPINGSCDLRSNRALILCHFLCCLTQTNQRLHQRNITVLGISIVQHLYLSTTHTNSTIENLIYHRELVT